MDIQKISFLTYSRPSKDGRFLLYNTSIFLPIYFISGPKC
nr:MAG TPA: hypothetical protein [Caudoviricetes sp.]